MKNEKDLQVHLFSGLFVFSESESNIDFSRSSGDKRRGDRFGKFGTLF
jgi:hypothetical protein